MSGLGHAFANSPTMFFEIIQRKRLRPGSSGGAQSFGKRLRPDLSGGNVKALFEAIERKREARGRRLN